MDDKNLMENILLLEKGVCDLFMHGAIESPTDNVHQTFSTALNDALCMHCLLYTSGPGSAAPACRLRAIRIVIYPRI